MDHKQTHPDVHCLDLYDPKRSVSECWIKQNVVEVNRHVHRQGRPSSEVPNRLRFDKKDHWPHAFSGWDGRVRCVNCKNQTNKFCLKCEVLLCCHGRRNCFLTNHTEENDQIFYLPEYLPPHLGLDIQSESNPDDLEERENTQEDRENTQEEHESFLDSGL